MDVFIFTKRLTLRPFHVSDASALNKISNEEYILRWMPDWKATIEDTEGLIQWFISQYHHTDKSEFRIVLAVELEGSVIGMVGIGNKEEVDHEIEIAFFISGSQAGHGYASEAVEAVSRWALDNLKIEYLVAIVDLSNFPSQRVIEKCGFKKMETRMIHNSGETVEKPFYYYRLYRSMHGSSVP